MQRSLRALSTSLTVYGLLLPAGISSPAQAQVAPPPVVTGTSPDRLLPLSAAEAGYHVARQQVKVSADFSFREPTYPIDSMLGVVRATSAQWLATLQSNPQKGIQLDPAGIVSVAAGQEERAKAQIAERLATPGLSFTDRAYTYLVAVQAFTSLYHQERLPVAQDYLKQLDALGDSAALWQFRARSALANTYYLMGRPAEVARYGVDAMNRVGRMPFQDRRAMFPFGDQLYLSTVEALTAMPDAQKQIGALHAALEGATVPPPALVAMDPEFTQTGQHFRRVLKDFMALGVRLGTRGDPIVSNFWLNRPTRDSATIPLNTGKIHLLEFGSYK